MKVELSQEQVQGLLQILNRSQFSGAEVEFVVMTKQTLSKALSQSTESSTMTAPTKIEKK